MNLFPSIADKIACDPAVIGAALETLGHWETMGVAPPARLAAWRRILRDAMRGQAGLNRLLAVLRDDSERNRRLLDFAPFAGLPPREERRKAFAKCAYDHCSS